MRRRHFEIPVFIGIAVVTDGGRERRVIGRVIGIVGEIEILVRAVVPDDADIRLRIAGAVSAVEGGDEVVELLRRAVES